MANDYKDTHSPNETSINQQKRTVSFLVTDYFKIVLIKHTFQCEDGVLHLGSETASSSQIS
jgi:hypothetical protein